MTFVLVFLCAVVLDFLYSRWVWYVSTGAWPKAALASMGVGACGLFGVYHAVSRPLLAIPYLLGLGVGTALAVMVTE